MKNTYSTTAFLKKERRLKNQNGLIMRRITVDKKKAEISIKRTMDSARWDSKSSRVKGNKEDAREVNCLIDQLTLKINGIYNRLVESEESVTARRSKEYLWEKTTTKKPKETFTSHNEMMKSRIGIDFSKSTFTRYSTTYDDIIKFLNHQYNQQDIRLRDLHFSFITEPISIAFYKTAGTDRLYSGVTKRKALQLLILFPNAVYCCGGLTSESSLYKGRSPISSN